MMESYNLGIRPDLSNPHNHYLHYMRQDSNRSNLSSTSSHTSDFEYESKFDSNADLYHYFMNIAILRAKSRKNFKHQAGACIVNADNRIVGIGNYSDLKKSNGLLSWFKTEDPFKSRTDYINHAEMQAILNRTESNLDNCTLFVTTFPCMECAKMILQSGVRHIVYIEDSQCQKQTEEETAGTKHLFQLSGITFTKLN